jgi:hypothetical protein
MLSVTNKNYILSVVILNVVMLSVIIMSVVAPLHPVHIFVKTGRTCESLVGAVSRNLDKQF